MATPAQQLAAELARLCQHHQLNCPVDLLSKASRHFELLLKWNEKISLTTIVDPLLAARQHYFEPLLAAEQISAELTSGVDIGSGGGFPGIPIALARPALTVTLVEADRRKAAFLGEARRQLALPNLQIINDRFENLTCNYQLMMSRALERFSQQLPKLLEFAQTANQILLFLSETSALSIQSQPSLAGWQTNLIRLPESRDRVVLILTR